MRSVELARAYGVKLHVRSAFSWVPGTWVTKEGPMEGALISAVTHDTSEAKMTVSGVVDRPGVAALLFRTLATADINVDMIVQNVSAQGHTDISFTVPHDQVEAALGVGRLYSRVARRGRRCGRRRNRSSQPCWGWYEDQPGSCGHHVRDSF